MKQIASPPNHSRRREGADSMAMSAAARRRRQAHGSVLIIVLWIALGLVAITLYFANAMSSELRAADNRVAMLAADQAIEGAARYVASVLTEQATNGIVPYITDYANEAVAVGEAHFWLLGRDFSQGRRIRSRSGWRTKARN
ncbi:MAG: hypothetical protein V9H26_00795 [Verrucomicrobiota bacterium]